MDIAADVLYPAIDEISPRLAEKLEKSRDASLYPGGLDSIQLVRFIALVEEKIETKTGKILRLVTDLAMARANSPFRTVGSLCDYVSQLLNDGRPV